MQANRQDPMSFEDFQREDLQQFFDLSPLAFIRSDASGRILTVNQAAIDTLAPIFKGRDIRSLRTMFARIAPELNSAIDRFAPASGVICNEYRIEAATRFARQPDRFIEVTLTKLRPDLLTTVITDRTEAVLHQRDLYRRGERMRAIVECLPNSGIFTISRHGRVDGWNQSAETITGLCASEVLGAPFADLLEMVGIDAEPDAQILQRSRDAGWTEFECWVRRRQGGSFWCNSLITTLYTAEGHFDGFSIVARDMTERKASERELRRLAETDPLTEVYNRRSFLDLAQSALSAADKRNSPCAFAMLDIDHFKHLNDAHGHAAGDRALKEFVRCIRLSLRKSDLFGRIGGEEFGVFLDDIEPASADALLDRMRMAVESRTFRYQDKPLRFTVSIGMAMARGGGEALEEIMSRADEALYTAKQNGRNKVICLT